MKRVGTTCGFCRVTGYPSLWYFFSNAVSVAGEADVDVTAALGRAN